MNTKTMPTLAISRSKNRFLKGGQMWRPRNRAMQSENRRFQRVWQVSAHMPDSPEATEPIDQPPKMGNQDQGSAALNSNPTSILFVKRPAYLNIGVYNEPGVPHGNDKLR
jgi:hypothetical protein